MELINVGPWKNRNGYDPQNQLKAVEAEQHSIEHKLQPQHKGLQQKVVDAQHRTGHQNCNTHKQSQRALAQVPLPAIEESEGFQAQEEEQQDNIQYQIGLWVREDHPFVDKHKNLSDEESCKIPAVQVKQDL